MEDNDTGSSGGGGLPGFLLPVATAVLALVAGAAIGGLVVWVARPPEVQVKEVPRNLTQDELKVACAPLVDEVTKSLEQAQDKVTTLMADVKDREQKVQDLEAEMKRRGAKGAELKKQLDDARAELETVKGQLKQALQEKEELVHELKKTLADLDDQKQQTHAAKEESLQNEWTAFVNQSQLDICEKGNRKKLGKCREDVVAKLDAGRQAKYSHCIHAGQEPPSMHEAQKGEQLPVFAEYLDQDDKIVKDWYVLFCDPNLPEAEGTVADARPASADEPSGSEPKDASPGSDGAAASGDLLGADGDNK